MPIGTYGDIIFETSDKRVLSPTGLKRTAGSAWATHELHGCKPRTEYLAPALRRISFDLTVHAMLGVRPRQMLDKLAAIAESGQAYRLVIGGKPMSENPMRITEVSETWDTIYNRGELVSAVVSVQMEEYT